MSDIATAFADEVVTNAYTKIISVPGIEGPFALITLDNGFDHTKPSSFGPRRTRSIRRRPRRSLCRQPGCHRRHRQALHLRRRRGPQGCSRDHLS